MGLNWKIIREELSGVISDSLAELVEGAEDDLKAYAVGIANSLIIAVRTGRADLRQELQDQVVMIAEIHRIRISNEAEVVLNKIVNIGMRLGRAALGV
jgi:predicted neutral ceramidase superfamily lipid hydrolase